MLNTKSKFSLYLNLFQFQKYLYLLIRNFPREYKYSLGKSILETMWETIDSSVVANLSENKNKQEKIIRVSESFDKLKVRLRMAWELKLINNDSYSYIIKENVKIGTEITNWLKWARRQA